MKRYAVIALCCADTPHYIDTLFAALCGLLRQRRDPRVC